MIIDDGCHCQGWPRLQLRRNGPQHDQVSTIIFFLSHHYLELYIFRTLGAWKHFRINCKGKHITFMTIFGSTQFAHNVLCHEWILRSSHSASALWTQDILAPLTYKQLLFSVIYFPISQNLCFVHYRVFIFPNRLNLWMEHSPNDL